MKKIILKKNMMVILAALLVSVTFGQETPLTLKIGSQAPQLKVKWVKGTPITNYDNDKLYVVEFWATWCGPCKAAMPHLSELAKKYEGKVVFIGVNVWEDHGAGKEPYENALPAIKEFVSAMGDKMAYNVAMDNNDQYMGNHWMKASGQNGIPSTFLIKEGKIIWIGHPMKLDNILEEVLSDTYDMESNAKEFNEEHKKMQGMLAPFNALNKKVNEAIASKDYSEALNAIDNAIVTINPVLKLAVYNLKFTTLLEFDIPKALAFAKEWKKETPSAGSAIGSTVASKDGLPKEAYQLGVDIFSEMLSAQGGVKPMIYDFLAKCYFKMNDIPNAIASEKRAIESGKKAIETGEFQGTINKNTLKEYEKNLAKYKAAKK